MPLNDESKQAILKAIAGHPEILQAAITGSLARQEEDRFSDLDLLLVARDARAVRDVRAWFPVSLSILVCAFHLEHYGTILLEGFDKIDLAIFSEVEPASLWIVHDYQVVKGGGDFAAQLAAAALLSRESRAAHLNPDVSLDNILLLLLTALQRMRRGEELSAHGFVAMAADMAVSLEKRLCGLQSTDDLLDPRRRLEKTRGELAHALHQCLFHPPDRGIQGLARYLSQQYGKSIGDAQKRVLQHLLD
ncbi:MAG: nucleotidyltransferase domain-containing protein [Candidatus Sulfopaludibacter sp.]|nr:nucleotidyltransferase domain-containing protein [Candidatus Sulfopaludibacter sp.]